MKRMLSVGLLAVLLASFLAIEAQAARVDHHIITVRGEIVEVGDAGFVLRVGEDRLLHVRVIDRTRITLNGEPAHLSDLQAHDRAAVRGVLRFHNGHPVLVALRVAAFRRG